MIQSFVRVLLAIELLSASSAALAEDANSPKAHWPQFRGPNGRGIALVDKKLPIHFGPEKGVLWKTTLPNGVSSPCIWGDCIFLTGFDKNAKKLETLCLDRHKGKILWRQTAPAEKIEKVHAVSSPANSTPATDGERVYVFFGSYGLVCYDFDGNEKWKLPLPMPKTRFGTGSSPVVADELVLFNYDYPPQPFLLAVDRKSGKEIWKKERFVSQDGYATPVIFKNEGKDQAIIHSFNRLTAYNLKDGSEEWWLNVSSGGSTPVLADGQLFVASFALGKEESDAVKLPTFAELLKQYDKNKDGRISKDEFPPDLSFARRADAGDIPGADVKIIWFFDQMVQRTKDKTLGPLEWGFVMAFANMEVEHGVLAIKPGGKGNLSKTAVQWKEKAGVPEIPSPLCYQGRLYAVRDGGFVSCLDTKLGKLIYRERLGPGGAYFASPVAGDGKIYCASQRGVVSVLAAGDTFQVLTRNDFQVPIVATPALVDGKIYLRTEKALYAIGE